MQEETTLRAAVRKETLCGQRKGEEGRSSRREMVDRTGGSRASHRCIDWGSAGGLEG